MKTERALVAAAALVGLIGVALSAAAAHVTGGGNLETAARFLMLHAPVLLAIAALVSGSVVHAALGRAAALLLVLGLALFAGDLSLRALRGVPLFALAAPTGGVALLAGWALLALAALWPARRRA